LTGRRIGRIQVSMSDSSRASRVIDKMFSAHGEDPRVVELEGRIEPWSVFYHERMLAWLERLQPAPSELLRIAAAGQHIRRWKTPREDYPEGKLGYKKWRYDLAVFHGEQVGSIMREEGYSEDEIERVKELLLKKDLKSDPETQTLEDVICLVFLENEFGAFAGKHDEEKVGSILRKTWRKMSRQGQEEALKLAAHLPKDLLLLVQRSLGEG